MAEANKQTQQNSQERGIVQYQSRDGQQIKLSFEAVRKYLVSGHPEYVSDTEIVMYMGMCKAKGMNPFNRDCFLVKYTEKDPAATIVSIDYYRARAKAQEDCVGWTAGIIIKCGDAYQEREGSVVFPEDDALVGGWFRAKPKGWETVRYWSVQLNRYIKMTNQGSPTSFWQKEKQAEMIAKVAESQGLRRVWPEEFGKLYIAEEVIQGLPGQAIEIPMPTTTDEKATKTQAGAEQTEKGEPEQHKDSPLLSELRKWLAEGPEEEIMATKNLITEKHRELPKEDREKIIAAWNVRKNEISQQRKAGK